MLSVLQHTDYKSLLFSLFSSMYNALIQYVTKLRRFQDYKAIYEAFNQFL